MTCPFTADLFNQIFFLKIGNLTCPRHRQRKIAENFTTGVVKRHEIVISITCTGGVINRWLIPLAFEALNGDFVTFIPYSLPNKFFEHISLLECLLTSVNEFNLPVHFADMG